MYFQSMYHLYECRVIVIDDLTVADIQVGDFSHIVVGESEIPDVEVLLHPVSVD